MSVVAKGKTMLSDLAAKLAKEADRAADYISDTRRMGFYVSSKDADDSPDPGVRGHVAVTIDDVDGDTFSVTDYAQGQMAARLHVPQMHWDRLRDNYPELLQNEVRTFMVNEPEIRMLRTLDGDNPVARAYLSNKYRRLDNYDYVARSIAPALADLGDSNIHVLDAKLTDLRMYVKVLFPDVTIKAPDGHDLHGGAIFGNSEVGAGSFFIDPFLYRSFCENGLVFGKQQFADFGLRKTHIGRRIEDNEQARAIFTDETMRKEDEALFAMAYDMIVGCVNGIHFEAIKAEIERVAGIRLDGDVPETVKKLGKASGLREGEQTALMAHLIEGGDLSAWGYLNAVTRTARDVQSYDRQIELERAGADMLTWSNRAWNEIRVAAAVA